MSTSEPNDESTDEQRDSAFYVVQYQEPAGYGGKWRNRTKRLSCERVQVSGKIVRFIEDGEDKLAVQQDHMIGYEKKW